MAGMRSLFVGALPLLVLCFVAVLGIYAAGHYLEDRIARNQHMSILNISETLLPLDYDSDLAGDRLNVTIPTYFGTEMAANIYRARLGEEPVGLIFNPVIARGYNGIMEMAIGIKYDGTVTGVRILQHRETPGLGDKVHQDNSDWISGFDGRSLADTPKEAWEVEKDGGVFDHLSGATVSQRAVIRAVEHTLNYYKANREHLFDNK